MIKLITTPEYDWDVSTDHGKFTGTFRRVTQSRVDQIVEQLNAATLKDPELVDEVFAGWRDVEGSDGQPLAVTPGNRALLLDVVGIRAAVIRAWFDSISGAPRKN